MTYISGFLVPVPTARREDYRRMAEAFAHVFRDYGATEIVEAWGENIPDGTVTDFRRAVQATAEESVVLSWIVWPDKATADACEAKMHEDERFAPPEDMIFDGKRMVFGGFVPIVTIRA